jgi:hypothetical protein
MTWKICLLVHSNWIGTFLWYSLLFIWQQTYFLACIIFCLNFKRNKNMPSQRHKNCQITSKMHYYIHIHFFKGRWNLWRCCLFCSFIHLKLFERLNLLSFILFYNLKPHTIQFEVGALWWASDKFKWDSDYACLPYYIVIVM